MSVYGIDGHKVSLGGVSMKAPIKTLNSGESFIELPDELVAELEWKEGDELEWSIGDDGRIYVSKVSNLSEQ